MPACPDVGPVCIQTTWKGPSHKEDTKKRQFYVSKAAYMQQHFFFSYDEFIAPNLLVVDLFSHATFCDVHYYRNWKHRNIIILKM
jgi:hypothetical protein